MSLHPSVVVPGSVSTRRRLVQDRRRRSPGAGSSSANAAGLVEPKADLRQRLMHVVWIVFLLAPQFLLLAYSGSTAALRIPNVLLVGLAVLTALKQWEGGWIWGLLGWIVVTVVDIPGSHDPADAIPILKGLVSCYLIGLCLLRSFRTPRGAEAVLFVLCVVQYLWWGAWGVRHGLVVWHPDLANYDGYGPLMAGGVGPAYYFAMASPRPWGRRLGLAAAALCVLGVVSAFKRGAVLGLVVAMCYIWLRSPRKGRTFGMIAVLVAVGAIVASKVKGTTHGADSSDDFWTEMSTMFETKEGSTGADRLVLAAAARRVFLQHPIFGAGAENFGSAAATELRLGDVGGAYAADLKSLWGRQLHNIYFQLLSEYGIVGVSLFLQLIYVFWKTSESLRRPEALASWRAKGGRLNIGYLALGLQCGMIGFLSTGYFYNTLFTPQLYSLLFANLLLNAIARGDTVEGQDAARQVQRSRMARPRRVLG